MEVRQIEGLVDHLFRLQYGQMVSLLTNLFGPTRLTLAEDVVQEAMIRALKQWPFRGVPDQPGAWLIRVARNLALDILRREQNFSEKRDRLERTVEVMVNMPVEASFEGELQDDQLCLMFTCCHPDIPLEGRLALTLKTACGFGTCEIARAFLLKEATVAQRLVRAKRRIRERKISFALPQPEALKDRLRSVLDVLYLMFNEGHTSNQGKNLVRVDICSEAIRLTRLLANHPVTGCPEAHALAALLLFQGARLSSRTNHDGDLQLLAEQDRSLWQPELIHRGLEHLHLAASGDELSDFHIEAEIAAHHVTAPDYGQTNWTIILELYDRLWARKPTPVIGLNRTVAMAESGDVQSALESLNELAPHLKDYYPFYVTRGVLYQRCHKADEARASFQHALDLCASEPIRRFLLDKLRLV